MAIALLYVTFPNIDEAKLICEKLINQNLIACANYFNMESAYIWEGLITNDQEIVGLLKTRTSLAESCIAKIEELHSYKVPCIISNTVNSNLKYEQWIEAQTLTKDQFK